MSSLSVLYCVSGVLFLCIILMSFLVLTLCHVSVSCLSVLSWCIDFLSCFGVLSCCLLSFLCLILVSCLGVSSCYLLLSWCLCLVAVSCLALSHYLVSLSCLKILSCNVLALSLSCLVLCLIWSYDWRCVTVLSEFESVESRDAALSSSHHLLQLHLLLCPALTPLHLSPWTTV